MRNVMLSLGVLTLLSACSSSTENTVDNVVLQQQKQTITPAFKDVKVPFGTYQISATEGGQIKLSNGTKISVPANAFVDKQGNPVNETVDICYREFHTIADVLASGIPMGYDSAGVHADFATAGMFEIRALDKKNEELKLAQGKIIDIKMASLTNGPGYNIYYFEEKQEPQEQESKASFFGTLLQIAPQVQVQSEREVVLETAQRQGKWIYQTTSSFAENEERKQLLDSLQHSSELVKPTEPLQFNPTAYTFDLNVDVKEFPELEGFENVFWQYAGNDPKKDPAKSTLIKNVREWSNIKIEPSATEGIYTMTLTNKNQVFVTEVAPMLKGKSLEQAKEKFAKKMEKFQEKYEKRKTEEARAKVMASFLRGVQVTTMGIWNSDKPITKEVYDLMVQQNKEKINAIEQAMFPCYVSFLKEGKEVKLKTVYSINTLTLGNPAQGVNNDYTTSVRFQKEELKDFYFSPLAKSRIILILEDGEIAYVDTKTIQKLNFAEIKKEGKVSLNAKIVPKEYKGSLEKVQNFIDSL